MASGLTNTLPRSTCGKCVRVLKELISGLDEEGNGNGSKTKINNGAEPPPLTLLRAIARSSQEHKGHDRWGQELRRRHHNPPPNSIAQALATSAQREPSKPQHKPLLRIEETDDGVRLTIPVETTAPALMKRWTQLEAPKTEAEEVAEDTDANPEDHDWRIPLATSVRRDSKTAVQKDAPSSVVVTKPLTIELKCRKCESTGPEAGARAFLMGPDPLSIVLCHNRIDADFDEVAEILTHELVHLYDVQTLRLDLSDCETVAYSEVRAAREAECHRGLQRAAEKVSREDAASLVGRLSETFAKHVTRPYCVQSTALGATKNMFPAKGRACLNKVWDTAYRDHRPFGRPSLARSARELDDDETDNKSSTRRFGTIHGTSGK